MKEQDFSKAQVGDKMWSIDMGECEVIEIRPSRSTPYIIRIRNTKGESNSYTVNGLRMSNDNFPSLFWKKPYEVYPESPKRKVVKTVEVWANMYSSGKLGDHWESEEIANKHASYSRIACVKLTGTYEVEE